MSADIQSQSTLAGEYYLHGVMETASGFWLKPDSTFEFFFSYGALDRAGSGTWKIRKDKIILNSRPKPLQDFKLINSKKTADDVITIKITDKNEYLLNHIYGLLKLADTTMEAITNGEGEMEFRRKGKGTISLVFEFCPEKTSVFNIDDAHNYYEFGFEPWIMELFFENFTLSRDGNDLKGGHPLLKEKEYSYIRSR